MFKIEYQDSDGKWNFGTDAQDLMELNELLRGRYNEQKTRVVSKIDGMILLMRENGQDIDVSIN